MSNGQSPPLFLASSRNSGGSQTTEASRKDKATQIGAKDIVAAVEA
jgi:hypothetical protein